MKKNLGFTSFEFYFVISVIGLVLLVAIQHYFRLAEETRRLSFEILAKNFSAVVYNYHSHWILEQQSQQKNDQIVVDSLTVQFSPQGWPIAINSNQFDYKKVSPPACLSLWNTFLQNPPPLSFSADDSHESYFYRVILTPEGKCRYELVARKSKGFYFEYSPMTGQVKTGNLPIAKNT